MTMSEIVSISQRQGGKLSMGTAVSQILRLECGQTSFSFSKVLLTHTYSTVTEPVYVSLPATGSPSPLAFCV